MSAFHELRLTKGHGTANDFVLLLDPDDEVRLGPDDVALLCDRRRGVGGDGLIRAVLTSSATDIPEAAEASAQGAEWFMDYSNGDGSIAEMCGNGVRVFAHFLRVGGEVPDDEPLLVGTRAGVKTVTRVPDATGGTDDWYRVEMGRWSLPGPIDAGADALVRTAGIDVARPGLSVDMGNPHTVVALAGADELAAADLTVVPDVDPLPPAGTNVEYIVIDPVGDHATGRLAMRVHERGVGETQSCGTGACAAALAARFWAGEAGPDDWFVDVPGGTVRIEVTGDEVALSGPAVLVADLVLA